MRIFSCSFPGIGISSFFSYDHFSRGMKNNQNIDTIFKHIQISYIILIYKWENGVQTTFLCQTFYKKELILSLTFYKIIFL